MVLGLSGQDEKEDHSRSGGNNSVQEAEDEQLSRVERVKNSLQTIRESLLLLLHRTGR